MAGYVSDEWNPLVPLTIPERSNAEMGHSYRISSTSDLASPTSSPPGLYDPHVDHVEPAKQRAPENTIQDPRPLLELPHPEDDGIDADQSQVLSESLSTMNRYPRLSLSTNLVPTISGKQASSLSSSGVGLKPHSSYAVESLGRSPVEKLASGARSIAGLAFRSVRRGHRRLTSQDDTIMEGDEMDMGLISSAARLAAGGTAYSTIEDDEEEDSMLHGIDISSFTGPMNSYDEATVKQYRRLESSGQLTGGLGAGLKVDATINSKDLYASSQLAPSPIDLARRLSRRGSSSLTRAATLRELGQREANKRGQVIEVVVEEPLQNVDSVVDLSSYGGGSTSDLDFNPTLKRTAPLQSKVQTYYPQGNWKPWSMRWPYLTFLVAISVTLAVCQEYLYHRSVDKHGLYTFKTPQEISTWDYFSFKYLPNILAVLYGILWQFTDFEVKRLEAYYQLSKDGGALAAESINVDYITVFTIFRPYIALRYKHWAVATSSVASLLAVSIVPTLQSASLVLEPSRAERAADPGGLKFVSISSIWSRLLTGVLAFISVLGCLLIWNLQRRRSGLSADVKGIAGIAAMATKSHVLMDFKDLDTVPPKDIHNKLKDHRYTLRNSSLAPDNSIPLSTADKDKYDKFRLDPNPHPLMLRRTAGIPFVISMILYLGFVPIALFLRGVYITDKVPWLLTALAVAIKIGFQTLEQDLRMMEPFYRLSCRHAPPKVLTLDYTSMAFAYMPIRAVLNGDYLVALVGLGSVLAEILTVCVTSFAGVTGSDFLSTSDPTNMGTGQNSTMSFASGDRSSGQETLLSFWISFGLAIAITLILIILASVAMVLRSHSFLPRQPSTIASVLAYIHQSKMLWDFVENSDQSLPVDSGQGSGNPRQTASNIQKRSTWGGPHNMVDENERMVEGLAAKGKTYGLGWFTGRDGEAHCGIDVEELLGGYKHRVGDVRKATNPWVGNWDTY